MGIENVLINLIEIMNNINCPIVELNDISWQYHLTLKFITLMYQVFFLFFPLLNAI